LYVNFWRDAEKQCISGIFPEQDRYRDEIRDFIGHIWTSYITDVKYSWFGRLTDLGENAHLISTESHFLEDIKDLLVLNMSNWIHIRLLNDVILIAPSLNHQDLLDVQILDFSGLAGF
jgi:hypothetical protein